MVQEVILYFQKILEFCQNSSNCKIAICSLIPRPRYPHLEKYFKQTSLGLFQLCKKYECATFIDCESIFYNFQGQILKHYYRNDLIHLNTVSSQMLARHVFNTITQKWIKFMIIIEYTLSSCFKRLCCTRFLFTWYLDMVRILNYHGLCNNTVEFSTKNWRWKSYKNLAWMFCNMCFK